MKGSIRKRSPGSWQVIVNLGRDGRGIRRRRTETVRGTKAQAQRRLRGLLIDFDHGIPPPERLLVRDWFYRWMTGVIIPHRRQGTKERYETIIRLHIEPKVGHLELAKVTPSDIGVLESQLLAAGKSPKTIQTIHIVLSGAFRHALRMEKIWRYLVSVVQPPPLRRVEPETPPSDLVNRMLRDAEADNHPLYPCIHLLAYTGMRRGEALGLVWDFVDLEEGYLHVKASLVRRSTGLVLEPPKTTSGERRIDLDRKTVGVLLRHQTNQAETKARQGTTFNDRGIVFADSFGDWVNPMVLTRTVTHYGKRAGFSKLTARSLRHFHASVALQSGQNIVVISKRLGHSNVSITSDIYSHSLPGWQKEAAEAFAAAMEQAH